MNLLVIIKSSMRHSSYLPFAISSNLNSHTSVGGGRGFFVVRGGGRLVGRGRRVGALRVGSGSGLIPPTQVQQEYIITIC